MVENMVSVRGHVWRGGNFKIGLIILMDTVLRDMI